MIAVGRDQLRYTNSPLITLSVRLSQQAVDQRMCLPWFRDGFGECCQRVSPKGLVAAGFKVRDRNRGYPWHPMRQFALTRPGGDSPGTDDTPQCANFQCIVHSQCCIYLHFVGVDTSLPRDRTRSLPQ